VRKKREGKEERKEREREREREKKRKEEKEKKKEEEETLLPSIRNHKSRALFSSSDDSRPVSACDILETSIPLFEVSNAACLLLSSSSGARWHASGLSFPPKSFASLKALSFPRYARRCGPPRLLIRLNSRDNDFSEPPSYPLIITSASFLLLVIIGAAVNKGGRRISSSPKI